MNLSITNRSHMFAKIVMNLILRLTIRMDMTLIIVERSQRPAKICGNPIQ